MGVEKSVEILYTMWEWDTCLKNLYCRPIERLFARTFIHFFSISTVHLMWHRIYKKKFTLRHIFYRPIVGGIIISDSFIRTVNIYSHVSLFSSIYHSVNPNTRTTLRAFTTHSGSIHLGVEANYFLRSKHHFCKKKYDGNF